MHRRIYFYFLVDDRNREHKVESEEEALKALAAIELGGSAFNYTVLDSSCVMRQAN